MNGSSATPSATRMIVVTASPNDAERIESLLRNAGQPVHAQWLQDLDDLPAQVPQAALLLCEEQPPRIRLQDVIGLCRRVSAQFPVLALAAGVDVTQAAACMKLGARDLVSLQHAEHLLAVLQRELEASRQRRALDEACARLRQVEDRHDSLLQDTSEARAYVQEGIHIRVNPAYARLFGYAEPKAVEGLPLMDLIGVDDRPQLKHYLRQCQRGKTDKEAIAFKGQRADGQLMPVGIRFFRSQMDDEECVEVHVSPQSADTAGTAGTAAEGSGPTYTGQHGRQALYTTLETALHQGEQAAGMPAAMFLRVDSQERLEQRLGFHQADQVFNELAAYLLQWCGTNDRAYRFSGGEFVVLLTRSDIGGLEEAGKQLRNSVAEQVFGGESLATTVTVSGAILPLVWHTDAQQLLQEARQRVTTVQQGSGSGLYVETPQQKEKSGTPQQQDKLWLARIKQALEQSRFRLTYKSIASLEGETSSYFDVLIRMLDENSQEIPALNFIPVAERHGLTPAIDQWVIQQVLMILASRKLPEGQFGLFVRISDTAIGSGEKLLAWLLKQLKGYPVNPEHLLFTFNEQGLLDHLAKARPLITGLKKLKLRTAINHFGVTSQSLQLLEQFPADFLRLDEAVIKSLANPKSSDRVSDILRQARQRGARIIAKQVTDAQTMALLWTLGVHFIEGDYIQDFDRSVQLPT